MNNTTSPTRWWDLPAAGLLLVALITASTRLVATEWTEYLTLVQTVVFFGVVAGLALGITRFAPRWVAMIAFAYGAFVVPWQLGLTMGRGILWNERIYSLIGRLEVIIVQLVRREVVQDSLLFLVLMTALFWVLGAHAGYTLTRYGSAWQALLPAGITLFAIHSFDAMISRRAWYLAVFLFFALVLVARMAYLQQHTRWQQSRTALPPHLGLDFIRFTLLATAVLVIFSWTAPAMASALPAASRVYQKVIRQPYNEVRDRMDNAFASLKSSVGVVNDYYGASVLLGRGNSLTDALVFNVKAPQELPEDVRLYWRARVYDTYRDGQWLSVMPNSRPFNPRDDDFKFPLEEGRFWGSFEIISAGYLSTLYSPSQPIWVSRPAQVEVAANPDDTVDLAAFRAVPAISPGQVYSVQASIGNATIAQMREAGTEYPQWIKDRYLPLPQAVTPRTRELAQQITAGLDNPYDKAQAITKYLRENITYQETVPNRPSNQEAVDWFLFDIRQGFCNYYATAEVVMLRSLGIPARWAVGYAQGEQLEDGTYVVRQRDAHAWPEVYFPGLGWIEFEPTAAQPEIERVPGSPSGENEGMTEEEMMQEELRALREDRDLGGGSTADPQQAQQKAPIDWRPIAAWGAGLLGAAGLLLVGWQNRSRIQALPPLPVMIESSMLRMGIRPPTALRHWSHRASLPPLTKAYLEINQALTRLGRRPKVTLTPSERAQDLGHIVPPAQPPAENLVEQYQRALFSPAPGDLATARQAGREVRRLSYKTLLNNWWGRIAETLRNRLQKPERDQGAPWMRNGRQY